MTMFWRESRVWSDQDRALAIALDLHEGDLCPGGCGHYLDETSEEDGWHEAHTVTCDACAARDRYREETKDRQPGEILYVTRSD